jgi:hypothetical protein
MNPYAIYVEFSNPNINDKDFHPRLHGPEILEGWLRSYNEEDDFGRFKVRVHNVDYLVDPSNDANFKFQTKFSKLKLD